MRSRIRTPVLFVSGACALVSIACTAILGSFDVSPSPVDAGSSGDGNPASTEAGVDAGADADAGTPLLSCTSWLYPQPLVVADLSQAARRVFGTRMSVVPVRAGSAITTSQARIVIGDVTPDAFTVHTVDVAAKTTQSFIAPSAAISSATNIIRQASITPFDDVVNVVALESATTEPTYRGWVFRQETITATGPAPQPFLLFTTVPTSPLLSIATEPVADNDLFVAVTYQTQPTPPVYTVGVGRATPAAAATLSPVTTSVSATDNISPHLLHTNGNVYVYGRDLATQSVSAWTVPETGTVTTPPTARRIGVGVLVDIAPSGPGANVLMTQGTSSPFSSKFLVGFVPAAAIDTWTVESLTTAREYNSLELAPGGENIPQWANGQIVALGRHTGEAGAAGLNFLWLDTKGVRGEQVGDQAILLDRSGFYMSDAYPVAVTSTSATFNVAWVESKSDDGGTYHVLYFNQLGCR
jgi:hypothetical protein